MVQSMGAGRAGDFGLGASVNFFCASCFAGIGLIPPGIFGTDWPSGLEPGTATTGTAEEEEEEDEEEEGGQGGARRRSGRSMARGS